MRLSRKFAVAFLAIPFVFSASPASAAPTQDERTLLAAVNATRVAHGLVPLRLDLRLERAARAHSANMLRRGFFAHGPVVRRIASFGARGPRFGENLAWGVGTYAHPDTIVASWLASPAHRANLLRPGFRRIGIGRVTGTFAGYAGAAVVTTDFAGR